MRWPSRPVRHQKHEKDLRHRKSSAYPERSVLDGQVFLDRRGNRLLLDRPDLVGVFCLISANSAASQFTHHGISEFKYR